MAGLFGEALRQWREAFSYSQGELAELVGVSQTAVSAWERGQMPRQAVLEALSDLYGVGVIDVLTGPGGCSTRGERA